MPLASEQADLPVATVGPRVYGVVDIVRPTRIAGWAIDRSDSAGSVDIDVRREGKLLATVRADRPRRDLERGGVGTGRYGFVCDLDPPIQPGFEFTVTATARTADGTTCELKKAGQKDDARPTELRLVERIFEIVSQSSVPDPVRDLAAAIERIEMVQARLEAALGGMDAPRLPSQTGLWIIAGLSLAVALTSLAIGLASMWLP
ncbi:MAG TPA: hypothetical protein VFY63_17445 [Pseudorhizobium sp.]|nr:hypothetical protein [Pseudorhizobium sp.]